MTGRLNAIFRAIPFQVIRTGTLNLVFLFGLGLADYGIAQIHRPSAIIFGGLAVAACAVILSGDNEPNSQNPQGD